MNDNTASHKNDEASSSEVTESLKKRREICGPIALIIGLAYGMFVVTGSMSPFIMEHRAVLMICATAFTVPVLWGLAYYCFTKEQRGELVVLTVIFAVILGIASVVELAAMFDAAMLE